MLRLPQFKNKHGEVAHSKADGSDWSPAQWFKAFIGECGEFAEVRIAYELGLIPFEEYEIKARKELADMQTYLDILSARCLDRIASQDAVRDGVYVEKNDLKRKHSIAQHIMRVVSNLGNYANLSKKFDRKDITDKDFALYGDQLLQHTDDRLRALYGAHLAADMLGIGDTVVQPHPTGVDLGDATVEKFNEVSQRVDADVQLLTDGSGMLHTVPVL